MTNGIIKTENGYGVKDFETGKVTFRIGSLKFSSFEDAAGACSGKFYPASYYPYLMKVNSLVESGVIKKPDADTWENLVYAEDYRGVWDGEKEIYRDVTSMDRGAATDEEIAYIDALAATYESLITMKE